MNPDNSFLPILQTFQDLQVEDDWGLCLVHAEGCPAEFQKLPNDCTCEPREGCRIVFDGQERIVATIDLGRDGEKARDLLFTAPCFGPGYSVLNTVRESEKAEHVEV